MKKEKMQKKSKQIFSNSQNTYAKKDAKKAGIIYCVCVYERWILYTVCFQQLIAFLKIKMTILIIWNTDITLAAPFLRLWIIIYDRKTGAALGFTGKDI